MCVLHRKLKATGKLHVKATAVLRCIRSTSQCLCPPLVLLQHLLLRRHLSSWRMSYFPKGKLSHCWGQAVRGERHSPILKLTLSWLQRRAHPAPCSPATGHHLNQTGFGNHHQALAAAFCCLQWRWTQQSLLPFTSTEEYMDGSAAPEKQAAKILHILIFPVQEQLSSPVTHLGASFQACSRKAAIALQFHATSPAVGVSATIGSLFAAQGCIPTGTKHTGYALQLLKSMEN